MKKLSLNKKIRNINEALSVNTNELKNLNYKSLAQLISKLKGDYKKPDLRKPLSESQKRNLRRYRNQLIELRQKKNVKIVGLNKRNRKRRLQLAGQSGRGWKVAFVDQPTGDSVIKKQGDLAILVNDTSITARFDLEFTSEDKDVDLIAKIYDALGGFEFDFLNIEFHHSYFLGGATPVNYSSVEALAADLELRFDVIYIIQTVSGIRAIRMKNQDKQLSKKSMKRARKIKRNIKRRK